MAASDDEVPPLEDVSELIQKVEALRLAKTQDANKDQVSHHDEKAKRNLETNKKSSSSSKPDVVPSPSTSTSNSFGGFKKGFLFGGSAKSPKSVSGKPSGKGDTLKRTSSKDDIPFIRPQNPQAKEAHLEMPEVQQAMDASQTFLQNKDSWLTEDLLQKVANNPNLSKRLMDPTFMQAITEFQTNPQAAMRKYQDNPEMQSFIKDFCGIMGEHLTKLGDQSHPSTSSSPHILTKTPEKAEISVHKSSNPKQATAQDERKMQEILNNPEIRNILQDPRVQKLFEILRTDPEKAQRVLQSRDPEVAKMIHKLCEAGLLQFQR